MHACKHVPQSQKPMLYDVRAVFTEAYEQEFIHQKGVLKQDYLEFLMELNDHLENESIYMQDLGTSNGNT